MKKICGEIRGQVEHDKLEQTLVSTVCMPFEGLERPRGVETQGIEFELM